MPNLVELIANDNEQEQSPCKWGNIVVGHACYCHHPDGYSKCPQFRNGEPYEDCELYSKLEGEK